MAQKRLSKQVVSATEPPASGYLLVHDTSSKAPPGFAVRVTAKGSKKFVLDYRIDGRRRRYTIGEFGDNAWSVTAAREEASRLRRQVDQGIDPLQKRQERREAPTVDELADEYLTHHAIPNKRHSSVSEDRRLLKHFIRPMLGREKVADVSKKDVERAHNRIKRTKPVRANRMLALLSKMFSLAVEWEWVDRNPCQGVKKAPEHGRERFLNQAEIQRLSEALEAAEWWEKIRGPKETGSYWRQRDTIHPERHQSANVVRMLMLTGSRVGEVLSATWDQFDLEAGVWVKPATNTKQNRTHRIPLSPPALGLLNQIRAEAEDSAYLFPGRSPDQPLTTIKHFWESVRAMAGLPDVRAHDLRHSFASILASQGQSLHIIGALLGHSSYNTTIKYAHLLDDPLREATNRVGAMVAGETEGGQE
jgi:integrase